METKPKNRAWVKDAAIVFLVVLLLLTFFSNTIMNHSLPEVATQMVTDGTITAKVRGTGTVAANGSHKVKAKANETIGRVMVKAGQEVSAGDVLFVLGPGDSDQLEEAKAALDDLQTQYAQAALSVPIADKYLEDYNAVQKAYSAWQTASDDYNRAKSESNDPGASAEVKELIEKKNDEEKALSVAQKMLDEKKLYLESVKQGVEEAKANYTALYTQYIQQDDSPTPTPLPTTAPTPTQQITDPPDDTNPDGSGQGASEAANTTENTSTTAQGLTKDTLTQPLANVGSSAGKETPKRVEKEEVDKAYKKYKDLEAAYIEIERQSIEDINKYQYEVDTRTMKIKAYETQLAAYGVDASSLKAKEQAVNDAWNDYLVKQSNYEMKLATQERSIASASVGLGSISNKIKRQQEKIKQLTGEGDENTVTANVSGTVTEVNCTAGDAVLKDDILCAIEVPDMGYTVSFSVTNDQAKRLHVGDTATISNYYWGNQIVATLSTIQTDKKNPMSNKLLTFDLDGDVTSGSEITVSVGQKSARYDLIIPNSAIRTDSNGSFVLAVMAKSSPLGNRYVAKRVAIEVLAADDTNSAVTADLSNGDYVITTSSAPIANGDMVRMADAQS